jgi:hypothetical protein
MAHMVGFGRRTLLPWQGGSSGASGEALALATGERAYGPGVPDAPKPWHGLPDATA